MIAERNPHRRQESDFRELSCDVLVVGGGCGGVAAALAASDLGRLVVLTEAGSRVGGQLTSQAVPPDEHLWVEITGTTVRYRQLRKRFARDTTLKTPDRDGQARSAVQSGRSLGEQTERRT